MANPDLVFWPGERVRCTESNNQVYEGSEYTVNSCYIREGDNLQFVTLKNTDGSYFSTRFESVDALDGTEQRRIKRELRLMLSGQTIIDHYRMTYSIVERLADVKLITDAVSLIEEAKTLLDAIPEPND